MAFRRNMGRTRRRFGAYRSRGFKRRSRYRSAYKSSRIFRSPMTAYKVIRLVGGEMKHTVNSIQFDVNPNTGNFAGLTSDIVRGTNAANRIGNWIQPINVHGHVELTGDATSPEATTVVRFGYFRWKVDDNAESPTMLTVMETPSLPQGPFNFGSKDKFEILYSRVVTLVNNVDNTQFTKRFRTYIKLARGPKVVYDDAIPTKFQIYFFALSDAPVGSEPTLCIVTTLRFTDA